MAHDFNKYPELTNTEMPEYEFQSPHVQIHADFYATVVKVHDGDTITLKTNFRDFNFPLRFLNIDAKELNEGGAKARDWLKSQILGREVLIEIDPNNRVDKYGRLLGAVIHNGLDMGETEIYLGLAMPFGYQNEGVIPSINEMIPSA